MAPQKELRISIPHLFRCPISLDLLRDPVTLSTGQTYDRSSIEKWVSDGNLTCPVTMQRLDDFSMIPNHTLRRLIQDWCVANRSHGVERIPTPKQPVEPHQIVRLKRDVASSDRAVRLESTRLLRSLAKENDKNKSLIVGMDMLPPLASQLFTADDITGPEFEPSKVDCEVAEETLGALVQLIPHTPDKGGRLQLSDPRKLGLLSFLLQHGSMETRINAGSLIEMLCESSVLRESVGGTSGIVEGLVWLLRQNHYPRAVKVGTRAMFSLCLSTVNWERAVAAGASDALVECLVNVDKADASRALATVELLCKTEVGREAVGRHALAVPVLVKMMLKVPQQATESATAALLAVCQLSKDVQREAVEAGIFAQLLLLLQSDCTPRAKTKARTLLKLLSAVWGHDPCTEILDF